jgi:hypothetical protein
MKIVTPFVLGSVVSGGLVMFSCPSIFSTLMSLRYPKPHREPRLGGAEEHKPEAENTRSAAERAYSAEPHPRRVGKNARDMEKKRRREYVAHRQQLRPAATPTRVTPVRTVRAGSGSQ